MKFKDMTINEFLKRLDSAAPTPGGGSAAALAVAVGISLIRMVSHITISKKKFQSLWVETKDEYLKTTEYLNRLKAEALDLVDLDTEAYLEVVAAYKLPQNTDSEKSKRLQTITKATLKAADTPYRTAEVALEALRTTQKIYPYAHKNAVSDIGVGVILIKTGLSGAAMNVKINMTGYQDEDISKGYLRKVESLEKESTQISEVILSFVRQYL
ncbi:MAG: cyclodeaminase/cyclohydrolase family protein [Bacilli bacterium]|nr:cyclodeaminase/cyclohydrolase family protein [Bacilli bacterium]